MLNNNNNNMKIYLSQRLSHACPSMNAPPCCDHSLSLTLTKWHFPYAGLIPPPLMMTWLHVFNIFCFSRRLFTYPYY